VAQAIISGFATWFAKAPILALYLRLFGVRTWVRIVCWFMLAATAIAYLVAISYNAAGCTPKPPDVDIEFIIECTHLSSVVGTTLGGIAVTTDMNSK
jgi:predicted MFS family arabinose efflux permease